MFYHSISNPSIEHKNIQNGTKEHDGGLIVQKGKYYNLYSKKNKANIMYQLVAPFNWSRQVLTEESSFYLKLSIQK